MHNLVRPGARLTVILSVLFVFSPPPAQQADSRSASILEGLWHAERDFGPEIRGGLDIYRNGQEWSAQIKNFVVNATVEDNQITFAIPGDRGRFQGWIETSTDSIHGHWIQPVTVSGWVRYASPVKLTAVGNGHWQGEVQPLRDRMTMYFSIKQNDDGTMSAYLRIWESNFGRFFHISNVLMENDQIRFVEENVHNKLGTRLPGIYYPDYDMFSVIIPDAGGTFDFWRATDSTCDFFPRPRTNPPYIYSPPPAKSDGWKAGALSDVGMAVKPIEQLVQRIIDTPMDSINSPYVHALLIARHGTLVVEEYFHGYDGTEPHDTRSASKSVTSTMVGIAINDGEPIDLSTKVYETMYDGHLPDDIDPRATWMTVKHLLTMTSGLACYDGDPDSPGNEDVMQNQTEQPDWIQYTLDLPMTHEPGEYAAYCSASPNLAGGVLSETTGEWLPEFYDKHVAQPLQMGLYHMNLMPTDEGYGGGGLRVLGRDFLKFGQLFLDGGYWNGKRMLSDEWVHDAIAPLEHMWDEDYGYGWWVVRYPYKDTTLSAFYAGGNGGQYIIGIPYLDLVVTYFAGNYNQNIMHQTKREFVPEYIIRAIEEGEAGN